jgi:hypothetical protein
VVRGLGFVVRDPLLISPLMRSARGETKHESRIPNHVLLGLISGAGVQSVKHVQAGLVGSVEDLLEKRISNLCLVDAFLHLFQFL